MKKDSNVIIRINSELKRDVLKLMKENGVTLSDVLNIYISDMVKHNKIPAVIKSKAKAYTSPKDQLDIFKIRVLLNEAINEMNGKEIKKVYIFGSFARNEQKLSSDVDLRIEATNHFSSFDIGYLRDLLKEKFNREVDIVAEDLENLDEGFANELRKEEICIYG